MRLTAIIAALGVCAILVATASAAGPPTKEPGKLIVGFDLPAPGFWNGRASGSTIDHPTGFEHSLALDIAKQLEDHATSSFGGHRSRRSSSPARSRTTSRSRRRRSRPQRAKVIGFSGLVLQREPGRPDQQGDVAKPKAIADLKSLQTCAQASTTGLDWIQHKLRPSKKPLVYSASSTAAFDAVQAGSCQALILDVPIVVSQCKKKPGAYGGVVGANRHTRGLRRGDGEEQPAEALRQQGDQRLAEERDDRKAHLQVVRVLPLQDPGPEIAS